MVFTTPPPAWRSYAAAVLSRRPGLVPAGVQVPRIEARLEGALAGAVALAEYCRLCGFPEDGTLPLTFPHVLASPLHLAMLSSAAFPVRLLGVVHVRNVIERPRPIPVGARLELRCWLEGHREAERGQEFDLHTEASVAGAVAWRETTIFLARRPARREGARREGASGPLSPEAVRAECVAAPGDLGRRYAAVSGDWNPIHLWPLTARIFGFRRPIAHGMWSLARVAASLEGARRVPASRIEVAFKLPVLLPAEVQLRSWDAGAGEVGFVLTDEVGVRPHASGTILFAPGP